MDYKKYSKIVVNSDLDALVSSLLLTTRLSIPVEKVYFVNPSDVQKGKIIFDKPSSYIGANIPYIDGLGLWFDHHESNIVNHVSVPGLREKFAPSCARIICNYFGFEGYIDLLSETDRIDSGKLTAEDLLNPKDYSLISCIIKDNVYDKEEMSFNRRLIAEMGFLDIDDLLKTNEVNSRVLKYKKNLGKVMSYMSSRYETVGNVMIVDMRDAYDTLFLEPSFKFMQYAFDLNTNVSIRLYHPNLDKTKTRLQVGASILNRTCKPDIGTFLKEYGGGGHALAAGVTLDSSETDKVFSEVFMYLLE